MTRIVLVVAKAPVAGEAKTRLSPAATPRQAARIAAAALLDTVDCALATPDARVVVAMTGDPGRAEQAPELAALLDRCEVLPQRGDGFPARLANAHADVADRHPDSRTVQIGMDTPQLTPRLLAAALNRLEKFDAVLGRALDGGWWGLALRDPRTADVLRTVAMSRPDTGARTHDVLRRGGYAVGALPVMSDVDTMVDARRVAAMVPDSRFAAAVAVATGVATGVAPC